MGQRERTLCVKPSIDVASKIVNSYFLIHLVLCISVIKLKSIHFSYFASSERFNFAFIHKAVIKEDFPILQLN